MLAFVKNNLNVFSSILYQVVITITNLICLKWITPYEAGVWQVFLLVESYLFFFRFGVFNAFNREYSLNLGAGNFDYANDIYRTTQFFAKILAYGILLLSGLSIFFFSSNFSSLSFKAFLVFSIYLSTIFYRNFLELTYRTSSDFRKLGLIYFFLSGFYILSILVVYTYKFDGYLIRILMTSVLTLFLFEYNRPNKVSPGFTLGVFKMLFTSGFPLFLSNFFNSIASGLPRIVLLNFTTISSIGLFSPINTFYILGNLVSGSFVSFFLPKINFEFGKNNNPKEIIRLSFYHLKKITLMLLFTSALSFVILPKLLFYIIPEYSSAANALAIVCLCWPLQSMKSITLIFSVLKQWDEQYIFIGSNLILSFFIPFVLLKSHIVSDELLGISISLICLEFLMLIITILLIFRIDKKYE